MGKIRLENMQRMPPPKPCHHQLFQPKLRKRKQEASVLVEKEKESFKELHAEKEKDRKEKEKEDLVYTKRTKPQLNAEKES